MKIAFFGPPGSGKGTYASRIAPKLGLQHIAVGDIFREAVQKGTPMGAQAKKFMDAGQAVPNEISVGVIRERLSQPDCSRGFILDSPYNAEQAAELDKNAITKIDLAVNIKAPEEIILRRLTSRRTCPNCKAIFNILTLKPKKEGICDKCGSKLIQRDDDKEAAVKTRMNVYQGRAKPMEDYYTKRGNLLNISWNPKDLPPGQIDMPLDTMVENILKQIKAFKPKA